ncbi:MAG: hypothetical protein KAS11_03820 [Candidatus Aenigmarchaeota archaeon]|nr:hypothetical protein [Candidatus Aenigmarchaeota archaeon]
MKKNISKLLVFAIITMYIAVPTAFAEGNAAGPGENDVANNLADNINSESASIAGITPDSPFYGIDVAMDNIGLMFTFNKEKRAEKRLQIADERLKEAEMMAAANNIEAMERARLNHEKMIQSAEMDRQAIGTGNGTQTNTMLNKMSDAGQKITSRVREMLRLDK